MSRPGLLLTVGFLLSGCGFQPLYASGSTLEGLQRVEVVSAPGRTGYLLKEQLDDQLARNRSEPARYRLDMIVHERRAPFGGRVNNIANRYEIGVDVDYRLVELASRRELKRGSVAVAVSYDSADPPYAGVAAQQSGEERGAAQAAVLLRLELARYFGKLGPR